VIKLGLEPSAGRQKTQGVQETRVVATVLLKSASELRIIETKQATVQPHARLAFVPTNKAVCLKARYGRQYVFNVDRQQQGKENGWHDSRKQQRIVPRFIFTNGRQMPRLGKFHD
jgi:hypothetical protein